MCSIRSFDKHFADYLYLPQDIAAPYLTFIFLSIYYSARMMHHLKSKGKAQKEEIFNEDSSSEEHPQEPEMPSASEEGEVVSNNNEPEPSMEGNPFLNSER
jgi:hypothetical protein